MGNWVLNNTTGLYNWVGSGVPTSGPPGVPGFQTMHYASKTRTVSKSGTKVHGLKSKPTTSKPKPSQPARTGNSQSVTTTSNTTAYTWTPTGTTPTVSITAAASVGIVVAASSAAIAAVAIPSTGVAAALGTFITSGVISSLSFPPLIIVVAVVAVIWAIITLITDLTTIKSDSQYSIQTRGNVYNSTGLTLYTSPAGITSAWGFPVTPQSQSRGGVQELTIAEKVFGNIAEQPGYIDVTEFWTISLSKGLSYNDDVSLNNARKYLEALLDVQEGGSGQKRYMTLHGTPELVTELNSMQPAPDNPPLPPQFLAVPNFNGNRDELSDDIRDIIADNIAIYEDWKNDNPNWEYRGMYAAPADPSKVVWTYPDPQNISLYFFDTGQIVQVPTSFNTKDFQIDFVSQTSSYQFPTNQWFHYTFACKKSVPFTIQYGAGMFDNTLMQVLLTVQPYAQAPKTFSDNFCAVGVGMNKVPSAYLLRVTPLPNLPAGTGNGKGVYALELTPPEPDTVALVLGVILNPPIALPSPNITFTSFLAFWTNVQGATDYLLDVSTVNDFATTILNGQVVSGTSFPVLNLNPNTQYFFRVRARAGTSVSGFSNVQPVTTANLVLAAPVATAATSVGQNTFTANWQSVPNALDYLVDVSSTADFTVPILTGQVVSGTSFAVPSLLPNTRYWYRVRARNGVVLSPLSNVITVRTQDDNVVVTPPPPLGVPVPFATQPTTNSFMANWSAIPEATSYRLDVSTSGAFSSFVLEDVIVGGTSRIVTGLTAGATYFFRVRAVNSTETSANSTTASVTLPLTPPIDPPVATAATNIQTNQYTANWLPVSGATLYRVYAGTSPLSLSPVGTTASTSLNITGLTANTTYYYQIDVIAPSVSERSNIITVTTATPSPPNGLAAPVALDVTTFNTNSFTAQWNTVSGANDYLLDVSTTANFSSLITNNLPLAGTTYNVTSLSPGTTYWFRVRARNILNNLTSANSNVVSITTGTLPVIGVPTITAFTFNTNGTQATFSFTPVAGATLYEYKFVPNVADPLITVGGLSGFSVGTTNLNHSASFLAETTYFLFVRVIQPVVGAWSSPMSRFFSIASVGTTPNSPLSNYPFSTYPLPTPPNPPFSSLAVPPTLVSQITSGSARINWFPFPDTYNYDGSVVPGTPVSQQYEVSVGRQRDNATFVISDLVIDRQLVSGTSLVLNSLQQDTEYFYSIHAVGSTGNPYAKSVTGSQFGSYVHTFRTLPQITVLPPTDIGQVRFQANWQTNPNAISYDLEIQRQSGQFVNLFSVAGGNRVVIEPPPSQSNFRYRVRAVNSNGARGDWSVLQDVTVQQWFEPVSMLFSSITTNSFRVDWVRPFGAVDTRIVIRQGTTVLVDTFTANQFFVANSLSPATTYNVQLFPRNSYGEMYMNPASQPIIQSVTTLNIGVPPPAAPSLTFTSSTVSTVTVNLTDPQPNLSYSMDIATDAAFTQIVQANVYAELGSNTFFGLQPDTLYFVRARGFNGSWSAFASAVNGRTLLGTPTLLEATDITETEARLTWTSPQSVTQSLLDVARDTAFTDFVLQNELVVGGLTRLVTGLQQETQYWARVRTENPRGITAYSNVVDFTTESDDDGVFVASI